VDEAVRDDTLLKTAAGLIMKCITRAIPEIEKNPAITNVNPDGTS
jgi:hypothetical protein